MVRHSPTTALALAQVQLQDLLASSLVAHDAWQDLPAAIRERLLATNKPKQLLHRLVEAKLLTGFQARRLAIGQQFGLVLGGYRVLDRLGHSSTSVVYRAEHCRTRRPVALKVLHFSEQKDTRVRQRFIQEVRIGTRLRHPHIARALGAGAAQCQGGPTLHYLVMEYVAGHDLEDLVERTGPLPVTKVVRLGRQMAAALDEGHRRRLIHRDVKPGNIRVTADGCAKLLDFGLARWGPGLDEPGKPLGTLAYMAPEQVQHADRVDVRADLYGLGGTLFWCLTGRPPFSVHGTAREQLEARMRLPPPSVRSLRPEVPVELEIIVQKMLALLPTERFQTPEELQLALAGA